MGLQLSGVLKSSKFHDIRTVHQVIIVDDFQTPAAMPQSIAFNIHSLRTFYPDAEYTMWNGDSLRKFIESRFDSEVLWAYDILTPYSYKCDLGRFCLMHELGGLYVDLGVRLLTPWLIPVSCGVAAFRDLSFVTQSWTSMQTGLIWSMPGRVEFKRAIELIVENCRARFYGSSPLHPTGPVVLGVAMATPLTTGGWRDPEDQSIGVCRAVTPESEMLNVAYIAPDNGMVALRTKAIPGDLSHLGLRGGNNYNQIWRARLAYGEARTDATQVWSLADIDTVRSDLDRTRDGVVVPLGVSGHVSWGPYVPLAKGSYRATVTLASESRARRINLEICAEGGERLIQNLDIDPSLSANTTDISIDFTLGRAEDDVECRLSVFGDFSGVLKSLSISALPTDDTGVSAPTEES